MFRKHFLGITNNEFFNLIHNDFFYYLKRKCVERSEKLKNIQLKISESQSKKEPAKQAKLAYVAAPSLQIRRKQMRHGTGEYANGNENKTKKVKEKVDEMHKNEATHTVAFVKVPKRERLASDARRSNQRSEISGKKTCE